VLRIKYDIIIAGAGPTGSTLAYLLARAGLEVLILEKELLPRDKPCGGDLTHKATNLLSFPWEQVVEDIVHKAILNFRGRGGIEVNTSLPMAYMVRRSTFDSLLTAQAIQAGAHLIEGSAVEEIATEKERVLVNAGGVSYEGRIFAGGAGR
jgi:flavin-dependent dehydrogenase